MGQKDPCLTCLFLTDPSTSNHIAFFLDRTGDLNNTDTGYFDIGTYAPGYERVANQPKFDVFTGFESEDLQWNVLVHGISINDKKQVLRTTVVADKDAGLTTVPPKGTISALMDTGTSAAEIPEQAFLYKDVGLTNVPPKGTISALMDTGTSAAEIPEQAFHELYKAMGGVLVKGASVYVVPCLAQANVEFTIGNVTVSVHPLDLTDVQVDDFGTGQNLTFCTSVYGPASYEGADNDIILGDAFLRNVYAVYNYGDFVKTESGLNTSSPFIQVLPLTNFTAASEEFKVLPLTNFTAASEEFKVARAKALAGLPPQLDVKTVNDPKPKPVKSTGSKNGTSGTNSSAALSAMALGNGSFNTSESDSLKTLASLAPVVLGLLGASVGLLVILTAVVGYGLLQLRKQGSTRAATYVSVPLRGEQHVEYKDGAATRYDTPFRG
ncbi:unnamed protein product [Rhizoctonia solani]|uniref:Peptidase A1 domain-containing protein n=1 Tax=Rhizoctonia solani TaxID=456999 RepID=A0A8H3C3Q9_9AGAM|nr:unnamed protein product [Rhizoctonia solani]